MRGGAFAEPAQALKITATTPEAAAKQDIAPNTADSYSTGVYGTTPPPTARCSPARSPCKRLPRCSGGFTTASSTSGYVESLVFRSPSSAQRLVVVRFSSSTLGPRRRARRDERITKGIKADERRQHAEPGCQAARRSAGGPARGACGTAPAPPEILLTSAGRGRQLGAASARWRPGGHGAAGGALGAARAGHQKRPAGRPPGGSSPHPRTAARAEHRRVTRTPYGYRSQGGRRVSTEWRTERPPDSVPHPPSRSPPPPTRVLRPRPRRRPCGLAHPGRLEQPGYPEEPATPPAPGTACDAPGSPGRRERRRPPLQPPRPVPPAPSGTRRKSGPAQRTAPGTARAPPCPPAPAQAAPPRNPSRSRPRMPRPSAGGFRRSTGPPGPVARPGRPGGRRAPPDRGSQPPAAGGGARAARGGGCGCRAERRTQRRSRPPADGSAAAFAAARQVWHTAPVDTLFPAVVSPAADRRGGSELDADRGGGAGGCAGAFDPLLERVLVPRRLPCGCCGRRTSTSASTTVTTVSVLLGRVGRTAGGIGALNQRWASGSSSVTGGDLIPRAAAFPGTPAARFGRAQRGSWTVTVSTASPVVVYAVSGFADGRALPVPQPAATADSSRAAGIAARPASASRPTASPAPSPATSPP